MRAYLIEKRNDLGLTQKEVAEKLDISESYYSLIENGERKQKMDLSFMSRLASVFQESLDWIIQNEQLLIAG